MVDDGSTAAPPGATPGRLVIADRVVERVATYAAAEVDGVASIGSALERAVGRAYPKADAHIAGDRVRLSIDVAVVWPASLPQVATAVRQHVHDQITALVGLHVDAVDVTTAKVVHAADAHAAPSRRVQ